MGNKEFIAALDTWAGLAKTALDNEIEYRRVHGRALAESTAKNAEGRRAEADEAAVEEYRRHKLTDIEAQAAYHLMMHLRDRRQGNGGEERP